MSHPTASPQPLWPLCFIGAFVIPLCLSLMIGVPYQILLDRDISLHGKIITATAIDDADMKTKSGWVRNVNFQYNVNGRDYTQWLGASFDTKTGATAELIYSPLFPWYARYPAPITHAWNENMWSRLAISYALAITFGGVWLTGFYSTLKKRNHKITHNENIR